MPAATEILYKMISSPRNEPVVNWLHKKNFFQNLLRYAIDHHDAEKIRSALFLLENTIIYLCEAKDNDRGKYSPAEPDFPSADPVPVSDLKPLINAVIKSPYIISTLLNIGISKKNYRMIQIVSFIVRFCSLSPSPASRLFIDNLETTTSFSTTVLDKLNYPVFKFVFRNLQKIKNGLECNSKSLGLYRLSLIELIADCLECGYTRLVQGIVNQSIIFSIIKIFFDYPLNNFAQFAIYRCLIAAFTGPVKALRIQIIKNARFFVKGIDIDKKTFNIDVPTLSPASMSFFTLICQNIREAGAFGSLINIEQQKVIIELINQVPSETSFDDYCKDIIAYRDSVEQTELASQFNHYFATSETETESDISSGEIYSEEEDEEEEV